MERRRFLAGLALLVPAPAIVHASNLMPISPYLPDWITAHAEHPLFGTLIVRKTGVERLAEFEGVIKRGEFFWKHPKTRELIDLCVFPRTSVRFTPGMCSIINATTGNPRYHVIGRTM